MDLAKVPGASDTDACRDSNAGSFHLLLAHSIAVLGRPIVADIVRDLEVWNHPIFGYQTKIKGTRPPSEGAAPGTVREIRVTTRIDYVREGSPRWEPSIGTNYNYTDSDVFRYRLELDVDDAIIGGQWESEARPDFLWLHARPRFAGSWTKLGDLYEASIRPEVIP